MTADPRRPAPSNRLRAFGVLVAATLVSGTGFAQFMSPDRALRPPGLAGPSDSRNVRICSAAPGIAYAVWADHSQGIAPTFADVFFSRTTDGGTSWTAPIRLNRLVPPGTSAAEPREARIACDATGRVQVAWAENRTFNPDAFVVGSPDQGTTWWTPVRVNNDEPPGVDGGSATPRLTTDGAGTVYVAFVRQDPTSGWVKVNVSTDGGRTFGTMRRVDGGQPPESDLGLVCRSGGRAHIVWAGFDRRVWVNTTADGGATWLGTRRLDNDVSPSSREPVLAIERSGSHVYAAWERAVGGAATIQLAASADDGANWGTPNRVDHAPGTSAAAQIDLAAGSGGRVFAAWIDNRSGATHVFFTSSTDFGASWPNPDVRLDPGNVAGPSHSPRITVSHGVVGAVWRDGRSGPADPYFNRSTDNGLTWGTELRLATGTAPGIGADHVRLAGDTAGGWFAAWDDARNDASGPGRRDIFVNHSGDDGAHWNTPDARLDVAPGMQITGAGLPAVASDGAGRVFALSIDGRAGRDDVWFRRSVDRGLTWEPERRLDTGSAAGSTRSSFPMLCTDGAGSVYAVWMESDGYPGGAAMLLNRSLDGGATWLGTPQRINEPFAPGDSCVGFWDMACDGAGNVYVIWTDDRATADCQRMDAFVNVSHDRGATWKPADIRVNTGAAAGTETPLNPRITADEAGHVYTLFMARRDVGGGLFSARQIVNRSWDAGDSWRGEVVVSHFEQKTYEGSIAAGDGGSVYVVWNDVRNGAPDIYLNRSTDFGDTWGGSDVRLDGDAAPGQRTSYRSSVAASGSRVLVTFIDDRFGPESILANASADGGVTWLASAARVAPSTAPDGQQSGLFARPALRGAQARVAWADGRNGAFDTYAGFSEDGGRTWGTAVRVEAGDAPGASDAGWPGVSLSPDGRTHVVWVDQRGGDHGIRSNSALGFVDGDGDGRYAPGGDCNDADLAVWAIPSEVTGLVWGSDRIQLSWDPVADPGGTRAVVYDVFRQPSPLGPATVFSCLRGNLPAPATTDAATPPAGSAFNYLAAGENACGENLGRGTGSTRSGAPCP